MNDIKRILNILKENRNRIAENISVDVDYYSFLKGFDFALDEINCILDIGIDVSGISISCPYDEVYFIVNKGSTDAWISSKPTRDLTIWEIEGIDKVGHYFSTKEKAEMEMA